MPRSGIDVLDEYTHPSPNATAGHIHAEFNTEDAAMVVAAGGLAPSPTPVPSGQPWWMGRETFAGRTSTNQMPGSPPPRLITQVDTAPGASRNGGALGEAGARQRSQAEGTPTVVVNNGGQPPAEQHVTTMYPIPIPINALNEEKVFRALHSVNHV